MPGTDTLRLFYAVPFAPAAAEALERAARERLAAPDLAAGGGRWRATPAGRIHLTLKFLGETPVDAVPPLEAVLREAAAAGAPCPVALGGWVLLPGPRDPRVLAAGVSDPVGTLSRLAALLEERTAALGFARETRPFLAHVTVARRKAGRGRGRGRDGGGGRERAKGRTTGVPPPASVVGEGPVVADVLDRVVLMRSAPGPGGPAYAVVAEAVLGG